VNQGRALEVLPHDGGVEQEVDEERREMSADIIPSSAAHGSGQIEGKKPSGILIEKEDVTEGRVFWKICKFLSKSPGPSKYSISSQYDRTPVTWRLHGALYSGLRSSLVFLYAKV
jgi:hypothetical protein